MRCFNKRIKLVWDKLLDEYDEGILRKQRIIQELIENNSSKHFKYFLKWANYCMYCKLTENKARSMQLMK